MPGRIARGALSTAGLLLCATAAAAQRPAARGGEVHTVEGRVLRGSASGEVPVAGQMVILHRIASDSAGPVDSTRSAAGGRYRFAYTAGDTAVLYIASTRYAGIAYFTAPLRGTDVHGDDADIVVFDTTASALPLTVRGRHFVLAAPSAGGVRRVVDVVEIANDTSLTRVSSPTNPSWRTPLPPGARSPTVQQGDVPAGAVQFDGGQASVFAPFSPGLKQVAFTYELPASAFPVSLPVASATGVLEVLLAEPDARVQGAGLVRQPSVSLQGATYERYLGQNVAAGTPITIMVPGAGGRGRFLQVALVLLSALLLALGFRSGRRPAAVAAAFMPPAPRDDVDALARAIAALDTVFEGQANPDDATRQAYALRRADLKSRLVAAMAAIEAAPTAR